jgi:autotransporter-associated beta strand protein
MKAPSVKIPFKPKLRGLLTLAAIAAAPFAYGNTEVWIGAHDVSATTNWSDNANWINVQGTGGPGPNGNDVVFGDQGSGSQGTVNSVVDANLLNPFSLTFTNNSANGNYQTVLIPDGISVTNANGLTVGIRNSTANSYQTTVAFTGNGTFVQNGSSVQVDNSTSVGGSGLLPTLDLSGLNTFIFFNTNSGSALNIAGFNGSEARGSGLMTLAVTNTITVSNINVALSTGNGGIGGTLNLGTGTNVINTANINLGAGKINTATVKFLGPTGGLRIRGFSGADSDRSVNITLGNRANSGSGTAAGTFNFIGGYPIDVKANSMTMGRSTQNGPGNGTLSFDTGIFDITTINMAVTTSNNSTANITVSGGTLIVSNMSMANQTFTGVAVGNLNINDPGKVIVSNSIVKTTTAGTANITMSGGSLTVGGNVGTVANAIDSFSVANSTLTLPGTLTASVYATNLSAGGSANTINVTSIPQFFSYPAEFPLISYVNALGDNNTFAVGTLPGGFKGYISNNVGGLSIDIVITNGPALAQLKSIRWNGAPTGDWTTSPSVLNWLTNSTGTNYAQGDTVTFDDSLTGTTNVNVATVVTPGGLTVNNTQSNYLFTGTGKISGATSLIKTGTGTLILDNTGTNDFTGDVGITNGTVQIGNNDANGNLPTTGDWDVEGTLAFNRTDNLTLGKTFTGAGSLAQNGSGKLTINVAEPYTGGTFVNNGSLILAGNGSVASSAGVFVRGATFDISAAASPSVSTLGLNSGNLIVGTNTASVGTLNVTNSAITLNANANFMNPSPSIMANNLTTAGTVNYINITGVANVPDGQPLPIAIPIISYSSATFVGGFKFVETNFPNAYVTNNAANSTIDLVLTASPYLVTWNGGSLTGNNWTDSNNWGGVTIFANDSLVFDGTTRLTPVNDTAANTVYSNITFTASAGAFTLTGNAAALNGAVVNNSANPELIMMPLGIAGSMSLNGTAAPLIVGGGITNVSGSGQRVVALSGTGILTNLFGGTGNTNMLALNDPNGNWSLMDNAASLTSTVPWCLTISNGTFNFGSGSSAPKLVSTSPQGVPQDNQMGGAANSVCTLNFSNGVFTTAARFNTGAAGGSTCTINQYGGIFNIASQFQGANGSSTAVSTVNLFGGTMDIGVSPVSTNTSLLATNFGTFYVASRGNSSLTVTNSALLNCGILDVSRSINGSIAGIVNLDGGMIVASRVSTATANGGATTTGSTATFFFNGGTLKARASSTTFFQGSIVAPIVPITAYVTARGAIVDSDTNSITFVEPLLTDLNLNGAQDGGLTKLGNGTLALAGTNTYFGNTLVNAGTLLANGQGLSATIVNNGGTLGGNGVVGSNVTVNAGGTLAPGTNNIGTLTVAGNVTLAGNTTMEVDKVGSTSDLLLATNITASTIHYGGTLNVVAKTGAFAPGDTFTLFSATNYTGAFTTVTPANVTWDTSHLTTDGSITVVSVAPAGPTTNATITSVTLSGSNLLIHGTNNNVPNTDGKFVVLTSTNISTPLINWTPLSTNGYNGNGTFDASVPVVPGTPRLFIDVKAVAQ